MTMSTSELRRQWADKWAVEPPAITLLGRYPVKVQPEAVDAARALEEVLWATGYGNAAIVSSYYPRAISGYTCNMQTGGSGCSIHGYGLALDIDPALNPHYKRPIDEVIWSRIKFTKKQVAAIEAIRTNSGKQVWRWLGHSIGDTMHWQINVGPQDLATGIDPASITSGREVRSGVALPTGEDYSPWEVALSASWTAPRKDTHWERLMWDQGTLPFVHLMIDDTMQNIHDGKHDVAMAAWFDAIKEYEATGREMVIVLLPEMNGNWTTYGQEWEPDRGIFISWFQRMVKLARGLGIESDFCWAPNNFGFPNDRLGLWWPGDDFVDIVGMSCYNWGGLVDGAKWQTARQVIAPYAAEVKEFTDRPIVITQVGCKGDDPKAPAWLDGLVDFAHSESLIDGYIWFNIRDGASDFRYAPGVDDFNERVNRYKEDGPVPPVPQPPPTEGDEMNIGKGHPVEATVLKIQKSLLLWDAAALPKYGADGDYGNETAEWVGKFQAAHGVKETGIVDTETAYLLPGEGGGAPGPVGPPGKDGTVEVFVNGDKVA